jgi:leucyl-tRNA synthetase
VEWRDGKPYRQDEELTSEVTKMSKSRLNVVPPDELIARYGADTERVYTLFIAPPEKEAAWSDEGVVGAWRFLGRVWNTGITIINAPSKLPVPPQVTRKMHQTIDAVTSRIERFEFNTAISALMELSNTLGDAVAAGGGAELREAFETLLKLLHPFAPHMTEELWTMLGNHEGFILTSRWPVADPALMQEDTVVIAVQVNGKLRGQVEVAAPAEEQKVWDAVNANEKIQAWVTGKQLVKKIYVPGKLVNLVIKP